MNIPVEMFKHISTQKTFVQVLWVFLFSIEEDWTDSEVLEANKERIISHYRELNKTFNPDWQQIVEAHDIGTKWYTTYQQSENKKARADAIHVLMKLNELADMNFAITGSKADGNIRLVCARFTEGYTKSELFELIAFKVKEWKGTKMERYIRPATLFQKSKINGYINELTISKDATRAEKSTSRYSSIASSVEAAKRLNG